MSSASYMSLLFILTLVAFTPSTSATITLNQLLPLFGFPPGLIPRPVEGFSITPKGLFSYYFTVKFKKPCYVKYVYLNFFDTTFTGTISMGKITGMTGHKDRFPNGEWQDMYDVKVSGNKLVFTFSKDTVTYDRSKFQEVKTCRDAPFNASYDGIPLDALYADLSKLISQLPLAAE